MAVTVADRRDHLDAIAQAEEQAAEEDGGGADD